MKPQHYEISELEALTGLRRRTIRFYIKEGLIPPPEGAGRNARYGEDHLLRLKLIRALRESTHLRLEGIREQLDAMNTAQLRRYLKKVEGGEPPMIRQALHLGAPPLLEAMVEEMAEEQMDPDKLGALKGLIGSSDASFSWEPETPADDEAWTRVRLSDDVEIHYRESADARTRNWVKELIEFAKRLLRGGS